MLDFLVFVFDLFDLESKRMAFFDEFRAFCLTMIGDGKTANLEKGLRSLKLDENGQFKFDELTKMNRIYPHVLYPVFSIRVSLIRVSFGEFWWESAMYRVSDAARDKKQKEQGERQFLTDRANREEKEKLIRRMGILRYTFMPWLRDAERMKLSKLDRMQASLEGEDGDLYDSSQVKRKPAVDFESTDPEAVVTPRAKEKSRYEVER